MSVKINKISDERYEINDKLYFRNMDGEWVCPSNDLTPVELKAFREHQKADERHRLEN